MSNRRRGRRATPGPVRLTERDLEVLTLIGLTRYLGTTQVARACFPSSDRARRRLRQLYDVGYVKVTLAGSTTPNLVSLTRVGLRVLQDQRPEVAERIHLPGAIRLAGVPHHLAVVDARLYVADLAATRDGYVQRWSNSGGVLGDEWGLRGQRLQPDGLAEVVLGAELVRLAVEVDLATESHGVLRRKLAKYAEHDQAGRGLDELWVVARGGGRRRDAVQGLVAEAGIGGWTRLMTTDAVTVRPVQPPPGTVSEVGWARRASIRTSVTS